jgi:hypothetical protein
MVSADRQFSLTMLEMVTGGELKQSIAERFGTVSASIGLQYHGRSLRDRKLIRDIGATGNDPIMVCMRAMSRPSNDDEEEEVNNEEAERPENYDQLIRKLAEESEQPIRICKWCFDRHHYGYEAAFAELTSV